MPDALSHAAAPAETNLLQAFRRAGRNAAWLFSSQTLTRLAGFVLGTVLARVFGAERFGQYMFVMTFVMYFAFLADAGLGRFLIRDAARQPGRAAEFLGKVAALRLVIASAVYLVLLLVAVLTGMDGGRVALIAVAGLSLFSGALAGALTSTFTAREEMRVVAGFGVLSTGCTALAVLLALLLGAGVGGVVLAATVASAPPLLYLVLAWRRRAGRLRLAVDLPFWREALAKSFPYALLGVIGLIYFRMDSLLLTWLRGDEANGIYTAAYRLLDAATDVPGVLVAAMFPTLSRLHVESRAKLRRAYLGALGTLTLLGLPVMIGMVLLARPAVLLLYGDDFARSIGVLQLLAVAVFLIFVDTANTMVLYAGDDLKPVVWLSCVTTAANIGLCLLLIPPYGERGAALAMIGSTALSIAIFTPVVLRSLRSSDE